MALSGLLSRYQRKTLFLQHSKEGTLFGFYGVSHQFVPLEYSPVWCGVIHSLPILQTHRHQSIYLLTGQLTGFYLIRMLIFNPFYAAGLFLYPPKISENLWVFDIIRGYRKRPVAWYELIFVRNIYFCSK